MAEKNPITGEYEFDPGTMEFTDEPEPGTAVAVREVGEPDEPATHALTTPAQSLMAHTGLGVQRFTKEQQAILERTPDPNDIDILPTGEIYYGQVQYRRRLNEAFGPGGWGLIPIGQYQQDGETLMREYGLVCEGRIVATAFGETDFQHNNARFTKATATEVVKSIALRRTAKDLGIADDCWDKRFIRDWLAKNAIRVWCVGVGKANKGQKKPLWRRKDAEPFDYPWQEDQRGTKAPEAKVVDLGTGEPVLDPNVKWKNWSAKAAKQDGARLTSILNAHEYDTADQVKDRKTQVEIFKAWEGEENG